jgi:hypothetical protein
MRTPAVGAITARKGSANVTTAKPDTRKASAARFGRGRIERDYHHSRGIVQKWNECNRQKFKCRALCFVRRSGEGEHQPRRHQPAALHGFNRRQRIRLGRCARMTAATTRFGSIAAARMACLCFRSAPTRTATASAVRFSRGLGNKLCGKAYVMRTRPSQLFLVRKAATVPPALIRAAATATLMLTGVRARKILFDQTRQRNAQQGR